MGDLQMKRQDPCNKRTDMDRSETETIERLFFTRAEYRRKF